MVIKKLLERETNWKNWIKSSCPPFEKFPSKKKDEMTISDDTSIRGSKRITRLIFISYCLDCGFLFILSFF